jgi:hypothetical protein
MNLLKKHKKVVEEPSPIEFLYTTSRQFPFDEVCDKIVRELEKRNFNVPDFKIEIDTYGTGERKFRYVRTIESTDFRVWFCRSQGLLPDSGNNNIAAPSQINIPGKELSVHEDESGPSLYLYVGQNWVADSAEFMKSGKVNSKLRKQPRTYLCYKSKNYKTRPSTLFHDNDLGREYDPIGHEPKSLSLNAVFNEFTNFLEKEVLAVIMAEQVPSEKISFILPEESIPFPESSFSIFTTCENGDKLRIMQGKKDKTQLERRKRYGLLPRGVRLLSLSVNNDGTIPEIAYEGFQWCSLSPKDQVDLSVLKSRFVTYGSRFEKGSSILKINPKMANSIYIADNGKLIEKRDELLKVLEGEKRDTFTDLEVGEFQKARARTIIPINDYKGDIKNP